MIFAKDFPDHSYLKFIGKKVKLTCIDGMELEGTILGFDSALNNYLGADSLTINCNNYSVEVLETEIESIDLI